MQQEQVDELNSGIRNIVFRMSELNDNLQDIRQELAAIVKELKKRQ